jgi:hypothetical protein
LFKGKHSRNGERFSTLQEDHAARQARPIAGETVPQHPFCLAGALQGDHVMLHYTLVFLVVALIAGALGFGGVASASASIARILFA